MSGLCVLLAPRDEDLTRTLELELSDVFDEVTVCESTEGIAGASLLVVDLDIPELSLKGTEGVAERRLGYSRRADATAPFPVLHRPFRMEEWRRAVQTPDAPVLSMNKDGTAVLLDGESVALTSREAALLSLLFEADGRPVSREALTRAVFPDADDPDASLNVYVHYLRKKLERNRKRVILAHRGGGYSLLTK